MESISASDPSEFASGSLDVQKCNKHKCSGEMEHLFPLKSSESKKNEALAFFNEMHVQGTKPNSITMFSVHLCVLIANVYGFLFMKGK